MRERGKLTVWPQCSPAPGGYRGLPERRSEEPGTSLELGEAHLKDRVSLSYLQKAGQQELCLGQMTQKVAVWRAADKGQLELKLLFN